MNRRLLPTFLVLAVLAVDSTDSIASRASARQRMQHVLAEESGLGLISGHAYSAPYEDVRIRNKSKGDHA